MLYLHIWLENVYENVLFMGKQKKIPQTKILFILMNKKKICKMLTLVPKSH